MKRTAEFDETKAYRWSLGRVWDEANHFRVLFILLNPSTADAQTDDPTVRKCIGFAQRWGAGGLTIVNLFAFRATNPKQLIRASAPIGPENDTVIERAIKENWDQKKVAAWGNYGTVTDRSKKVQEILKGWGFQCFGKTKQGEPTHLLYQPYSAPLVSLSDNLPLEGNHERDV